MDTKVMSVNLLISIDSVMKKGAFHGMLLCYRIVLNLLSSFFLIGCLKISKILYLEGLDVG